MFTSANLVLQNIITSNASRDKYWSLDCDDIKIAVELGMWLRG